MTKKGEKPRTFLSFFPETLRIWSGGHPAKFSENFPNLKNLKITLPETNELHLKIGWLECDSFPFGIRPRGHVLLVLGRVIEVIAHRSYGL